MALIKAIVSFIPNSRTQSVVNKQFILDDWFARYTKRKSREEGVTLRNELEEASLSDDQILVAYQICRSDKDVLFVLERKHPTSPFTAQDLERILHNEVAHDLMARYSVKVRDLVRRGK